MAKRALEEVLRSNRSTIRAAGRAALLSIPCAPTTNPIEWDARNIEGRMPGISPASTRSTCCWDCAGRAILLRAAARRQDALHAPHGSGTPTRLHDARKPDRRAADTRPASTRRRTGFRRTPPRCLELCDLFGQTAIQHHNQLVARFIEQPAEQLPEESLEGITASGPPLPVLLRALEILRDMRVAANRRDIATRYADLQRLRSYVKAT